MPLYQYQCRECGYDLEIRQKFSDDPLTLCPECGEPEGLYRVVQAAGIVFKGSGFYITDSRGNRDNLTGSPKKKSDGSGDSSKGSNGASDTSQSTSSSTTEKTSSSKETSSSSD